VAKIEESASSISTKVPVLESKPVQERKPVPGSKPVTGEKSGWVVQVGSFATRLNANKLRDQLKRRRYQVYVDTLDSDTGSMFRVRVGPVEDREKAIGLQQELANKASLKGILVHLP
jgi:DedD protein